MITIFLVGCGLYIDRLVKIKNKYNIKNEDGLYKHVNKIHKWSEIVIAIGMIFVFYLIVFIYSRQLEFRYIMGALATLYSFRVFMEWKYEEESNRYKISILNIAFFLFIIVVSELTTPWL
ncbi:MAG: DUF4181 domain-containing protein [Clostridiaceae bacterium]|nr:DUF4181 domain-containing protein [Clostridiaceae bacterium]